MIAWFDLNVDHTNVLDFYATLMPMRADLPSSLIDRMEDTVEQVFELLDPADIAHSLPFDLFIALVSRSDLEASQYYKAACVVRYLCGDRDLPADHRSALVTLYLKSDWMVSLPAQFNAVDPSRFEEVIRFSAVHLSNWFGIDFLRFPKDLLTELLSADSLEIEEL
jgi:hypothetical protein